MNQTKIIKYIIVSPYLLGILFSNSFYLNRVTCLTATNNDCLMDFLKMYFYVYALEIIFSIYMSFCIFFSKYTQHIYFIEARNLTNKTKTINLTVIQKDFYSCYFPFIFVTYLCPFHNGQYQKNVSYLYYNFFNYNFIWFLLTVFYLGILITSYHLYSINSNKTCSCFHDWYNYSVT